MKCYIAAQTPSEAHSFSQSISKIARLDFSPSTSTCFGSLYARFATPITSTLWRWWCYPITYMQSGRCHLVILTIQYGGHSSKRDFHARWSRGEPANSSRGCKRERGIWQRRYWEHEIRGDIDLTRHIEYIHFNPVKHKHVTVPVEWPYSPIHRYIRQGVLTPGWAAGVHTSDSGFGERA